MQPKFHKPFLVIIFVFIIFLLSACFPDNKAAVLPTPENSHGNLVKEKNLDPRIAVLETAMTQAAAGREDLIAFIIYDVNIDHVDFSQDGSIALLWLAFRDPDTDEILPSGSGLVLATLSGNDPLLPESWTVGFQADSDWAEKLAGLPDELLSPELKDQYMGKAQPVDHAGKVFNGYKLPWQAGMSRRVSGSIGHVLTYKSCPSTCLYAFDFADGTMFPVFAARSGRVKYVVWRYPNGNEKNANFLVLEDTSTTPTTYQVYYHLAKDSIPQELRTKGAEVFQGQFIGNADDTGPSSGHHLHFHVHTNPNLYWGSSVDITFDDVNVNGGRPRTCAEAKAFPEYGSQCQKGNFYVSGNGDNQAPTGILESPLADAVITTSVMHVTGFGQDDSGLRSIQIMINFDGNWQKAGAELTASPFASDVDLCQAGIPDGPFLLGLSLQDQAGKLSEGIVGQRVLNKKFDCSPPPIECTPDVDQIAVYSDAGLIGDCQVLDMGEYSGNEALGLVGDDNIESLKIGSNVIVLAYENSSYIGNEEVLLASDENLSDNLIQQNTISSLKIIQKPPMPLAPIPVPPINALNMSPTEADNLVLSWQPDKNTTDYRSELSGRNEFFRSIDWQTGTTWDVGSMPEGEYSWTVWGRNYLGEVYSTLSFSILPTDKPSETHMLPLNDISKTTAVLLKWEVDKDSEDLDHFEIEFRDDDHDWQTWNRPLPGQLRQVIFYGEPGHKYGFKIRSVNIKGTQEEFPEVVEAEVFIEEDCQKDSYESVLPGDNKWTDATPLDVSEAKWEHNFCGLGDEDWVSFKADAGKQYRIIAKPSNSLSAAALQLYSTDGYNLLGSQKPEDLGQIGQMTWTALEDGIYFIRVLPLDSRLTGTDSSYNLTVETIGQVFLPTLAGSSLIIPVIWFLVRAYYRVRRRVDSEE